VGVVSSYEFRLLMRLLRIVKQEGADGGHAEDS
jgi:hypothetical protein